MAIPPTNNSSNPYWDIQRRTSSLERPEPLEAPLESPRLCAETPEEFYYEVIADHLHFLRARNAGVEKAGNRPCFAERAHQSFALLFPDTPFNSDKLLEKYLDCFTAHMNAHYAVIRYPANSLGQDGSVKQIWEKHLGPRDRLLSLVGRKRYMTRLVGYLSRRVFLDFAGLKIRNSDVFAKVEKEFHQLYQKMMKEVAVSWASQIADGRQGILTWDLETWVESFSLKIEQKFEMKMALKTKEDIRQSFLEIINAKTAIKV